MSRLRFFIWRWLQSKKLDLFIESRKIDKRVANLSKLTDNDIKELYLDWINHLKEINELVNVPKSIPSYSVFRSVLSRFYNAPNYRSRTKQYYTAKQCRSRQPSLTFTGYRKGKPLLSNKLVGEIG